MSVTGTPIAPTVVEIPVDSGLSRLTRRRLIGLALCAVVLVAVVALSLAVGARSVPLTEVIGSFTGFDGSADQVVVRELRVPRTVAGILVGGGLGVAGALMQAISRNPLADPGLLGVSGGASLAVVVGITYFGLTTASAYVWPAFLGAAVVSVAVYLLGTTGRGGATPVRLTLAGAALASLLGSITSAVLILNLSTLDQFRFWVVGSLAGTSLDVIVQLSPFIVAGLVVALVLASPLNTVALGDDTARALGTRIGLTRLAAALAITLLCGAATAACGPIVFVGLVIPHFARAICGPDQRWLIPFSALLGAAFLLACDVLSRIVARPGEIPVGITTAIVGGVVLVVLVRRVRLAQL